MLYDGVLARVVAIGKGIEVTLEMIEEPACPTCGRTDRVHLLDHSPLFQERVKPVLTVTNEVVEAGTYRDGLGYREP